MWYVIRDDELKHHGVIGQKWGVRRGPPYPIEDKVLPKGYQVASVSARYSNSEAYRNRGSWMYTYNPGDEWDSKVYKGPFMSYLVHRGAEAVFEHRFETVKDLSMPTKKERIDEFKGLFGDKKSQKAVIGDLERVKQMVLYYQVGSKTTLDHVEKLNVKKLKTDEDWKYAYLLFNHAMEDIRQFPSAQEYAKRISEKYDAMVDDNNQGIYNDTHDPIIIFKAKEALKPIANTPAKYVTAEEWIKNYDDVKQELKKKGRNIQL